MAEAVVPGKSPQHYSPISMPKGCEKHTQFLRSPASRSLEEVNDAINRLIALQSCITCFGCMAESATVFPAVGGVAFFKTERVGWMMASCA